jgi:hypothetical protein
MGVTWNHEAVERIVPALLAAHPDLKVCHLRFLFTFTRHILHRLLFHNGESLPCFNFRVISAKDLLYSNNFALPGHTAVCRCMMVEFAFSAHMKCLTFTDCWQIALAA